MAGEEVEIEARAKISSVATLGEVLSLEADDLLRIVVQRGLLNGAVVGVWRDGEGFARVIGDGVTVDSGQVELSDPVAKFLPGAERGSFRASPITLLDLATHCSGLPRLPPGLDLFSRNPYARYTAAQLEKDVAKRNLESPSLPKFFYSNYGYSVLGHALSRAAGVRFAELLEREVLAKAGLRETSLAMTGAEQPRLLDGYTHAGSRTAHWTFDACAPCGGLCSTVGDQLRWLAWILEDPDRNSLRARAAAGKGSVGLGWMLRAGGESAWHNGATFGFSSYLGLNRRHRHGVVVLSNRSSPDLVSAIGMGFEAVLRGGPVSPLRGDYGLLKARVLGPVQRVAAPLFGPMIRPIMGLPWWARLPAAGGIGYGLEFGVSRLVQLIHHMERRSVGSTVSVKRNNNKSPSLRSRAE